MLPPLDAIGSAGIEIFGPEANAARWDEAVWDGANWATFVWRDLTPESMQAQISWGADDPAGVLTVPAAGSWQVDTYDPQRKLDPSNGASEFAASIRPGRPMRLILKGDQPYVIRAGLIDEVRFDLAALTGSIRGTDGVQLMVSASMLAGVAADPGLPSTLRARARWLIQKVGLDHLIEVEPDVEWSTIMTTDIDYDGIPWETGGDVDAQYTDSDRESGKLNLVGHVNPALGTGWCWLGASHKFMDVAEGQLFHFNIWLWGPVSASMAFYDENWARLVSPLTVHNTGGTWQDHHVEGVAPAGAVRARIELSPAYQDNYFRWDTATVQLQTVNRYDPPVGPLVEGEASCWSHIGSSAFDALYTAWLDRNAVLRFRSFGNPQDNGLQLGGADGIPISTLETSASLKGVYTRVQGYDVDLPENPVWATSPVAAQIYGDILLNRDKPVPDAQTWVSSVLADRESASLQYFPGTIYPQTIEHLKALVEANAIDIVHLVAERVTPTVNVATRLLGGYFRADTGTGWTAGVVCYIPAKEWEEAEAPPIPPEPPIDPPPDTQPAQRIYDAVKDTRAARPPSGANYGAGTQPVLPVGAWQGWRNRAFIGFASIPFAGVVSVNKATLELDTSDQVHIGFGSSPKVVVSRVTQAWNEGTSNTPSSGNATVYPGPSVTSAGQVTKSVTRTENAAVTIDVTAIVRDWHGGAAQHGIRIVSAGEDSGTYTTEFHARESGTSSRRPRLVLDLTVQV